MPAEPTIRPPTGRLLLRGAVKHCPVCGHGHLFTQWFRMRERCPRCHFAFERAEGHWIGAVGINTIVTFVLLLVVLVVAFVATYPEPSFWPILLAALATAVVVPVVFFPFSKTIWSAVDLAMRPLKSGEADAVSATAAPEEGDPGDRTRPAGPPT